MITILCCGGKSLQGLDLFRIAFVTLICGWNRCIFRRRCFTLLCRFFLSRTEQDLRDCMVIISVYARAVPSIFFESKGCQVSGRAKVLGCIL